MFSTVIVLRIELRKLYLSRTVVAARYVSDTCFRLESFENQHSTTVTYLTWYNSRNTAPQVFPVVVEQTTELRLFYLSRTVVVSRCASDTCFHIEGFENQDSTTVAYSTCSAENWIAAVIPFQNHGSSEMCFRHLPSIEAFANQDSTTVAFSTWD
ncbi:hypothetical protein ANTQUA_LOCUS6931 [Anthophora quadrimaculata]